MSRSKIIPLGAALAALALVASGCAAASDPKREPTATTAESDGELVLYSGRSEDLIGPLVAQFTADTGIEVEVRYGKTGEMTALLLEEGDSTPAQVFLSQDAGALGQLASAGLTSTLPDDLSSSVPAEFTSTDGSWVGVTGRARVIAFDGEQLTESQVPDSTDALTDAAYDGQVAFAPGNASFQSSLTALRVLEGEDRAEEWIAGMAANGPILTESNGDTLELVNTGAAKLGLINHYYWFEAAAEVGAENMRAQLKFLPGDAGGIVNVTGASILAGAEGDPDALSFVEYLLSEDGQSYFAEQTYEYPLVPGIDAPKGLPTLESLANADLDLGDLESLAETQALLAAQGLI